MFGVFSLRVYLRRFRDFHCGYKPIYTQGCHQIIKLNIIWTGWIVSPPPPVPGCHGLTCVVVVVIMLRCNFLCVIIITPGCPIPTSTTSSSTHFISLPALQDSSALSLPLDLFSIACALATVKTVSNIKS